MASTSSNMVVIEAVVPMRKGRKDISLESKRRGKGDILSELPPLPLESELFFPSVGKTIVQKVGMRMSVELLMDKMPKQGECVVKVDQMARC